MNRATILIVDDDTAGRDTLRALLATPNRQIAVAANGVEALAKAAELMPDLILLDVMMPDMDGYEVTRRLRADGQLAEVPIILITALDDHESRMNGIQAGADDFISKPFNRFELRARVQTITRLNRYRRLVAERTRFENLIELAPDGIVIVDQDGIIQLANSALGKIIKAPDAHALLGQSFLRWVPPEVQTEYQADLEKFFRGFSNQVIHWEITLLQSDGNCVPVEIAKSTIEWNDQLATQAIIRDVTERKKAEDQIRQLNADLLIAYDESLAGWARALDLRDKETEGHSQRVTDLTMELARAVGFDAQALAQVRRGALLHDIGKIGIPDSILLKPGPLTDEEWSIMRQHPIYARDMLETIEFLRPALDIPYCHHEKWDGTGYPRGLKGEQIPLAARIFAVVDVWDALRSDRPYRAGWSAERVREYIRASAGAHFDPRVAQVFLKIIGDA